MSVSPPEQGVRWFDDLQNRHWFLAHPIAVVRKYADDRGSAFAGLLTFQIFLGLLPLLVVVLTVFGRIAEGSEDLRASVLESTIAQFPVVGERIQEDVGALSVGGWWVAVSIAGLLWTASGIYHSMQLALNQVWNVEGIHRQGFVSRHLRALILFMLVITAAFGTGQIRGRNPLGLGQPVVVDLLSTLAGSLVSIALLFLVFRIVVAPVIDWRCLVPAAVLAGLLWQVLQAVGQWIVMDRLAQAQDLYGAIGFVVVMLFWVNLLARSALFANEWAVVSLRELWPRRIAQPPLTEADREVVEALARNERRRPEEHIEITWDEGADRDPREDGDQAQR
jgi:YihY family inner membrane protein